jgi:hypothetical protein
MKCACEGSTVPDDKLIGTEGSTSTLKRMIQICNTTNKT